MLDQLLNENRNQQRYLEHLDKRLERATDDLRTIKEKVNSAESTLAEIRKWQHQLVRGNQGMKNH